MAGGGQDAPNAGAELVEVSRCKFDSCRGTHELKVEKVYKAKSLPR
jgi:hypothetical protein